MHPTSSPDIPRAPDQIVLGSATMGLHRHLGQSVHVPTPGGLLTLHIVGEMIAPSVGDLLPNGLGDGAWGYRPADDQQQPQSNNGLPPTVFDLFLVR